MLSKKIESGSRAGAEVVKREGRGKVKFGKHPGSTSARLYSSSHTLLAKQNNGQLLKKEKPQIPRNTGVKKIAHV